MSVCAAPTCSHQSFDGSSYYVDVDVSVLHGTGVYKASIFFYIHQYVHPCLSKILSTHFIP